MELRHLKYFLALAQHRHFGRAAKSLGIQQPPLSQQIKSLERELGARLFDRTSRTVELTHAGRAFLAQAEQPLRHAEDAMAAATRAARGDSGHLTIGFIGTALYSVLPQVFRLFRTQYPGVSLNPVELPSAEQTTEIDALNLDVGFVRAPLLGMHGHAFESLPVTHEPLVAVVRRNHQLARGPSIPVALLDDEPLIMAPSKAESSLRSCVLQVCQRAGFEPVVGGESAQLHTILGLVSAGVGIGIGPESLAKARFAETVCRPLRPSITAPDLTMMWRTNDESPVLRNFVRIVREVVAPGGLLGEAGPTAFTG